MWRIPGPLISGGAQTNLYFTADEYIGNLWDYLGQPSLPVDVVMTADNCDLGEVIIPADFNPLSTFQMTAVNGGRFLGMGGNGGNGGPDLGPTGESGTNGSSGSPAISSTGFLVNVDIDDGYLFGGGGGGGGASTADRGATSDAGGGGGGGQGWTGGTGGNAGAGSVPAAVDGQDGTRSGPGNGGLGGGVDIPEPDGGNGGAWGEAGLIGYGDWGFYGQLKGGLGGKGGNAFAGISGGSINYNGASSETTLRNQARILGETAGSIAMHTNRGSFGTSMLSFSLGWSWNNAGVLSETNTLGGGGPVTGFYWNGSFDNTLYEIRQVAGTRIGTWDTDFGGTEGDYVALTSLRQVSITDSAFRYSGQAFSIRRTAAAGGTGGDLAHGFYFVEMEDGS